MASLASRERLSFSKLREVLQLPDLIAVQRESFQWFLEQGVAEVLSDISPIEDFTGQLKLELSDHVFDPPKHSEDECRERDMTFARPLFVTSVGVPPEVAARHVASMPGRFRLPDAVRLVDRVARSGDETLRVAGIAGQPR